MFLALFDSCCVLLIVDEISRKRDVGPARGARQTGRAGEKVAGGDPVTGTASHTADQVPRETENTGL